ncbi:MAG: hypothetical protein RBR78_01160 [Flavobacteriaceae bacterium]|jgi:hypothetical protein|nr:hypothetical protein [Flavobacteriaceae bacterium]
MKKIFLFTILLSFAFVANSCSDDDNEKSLYPNCLNTIIEDIMEGEVQSPKPTIDKYIYQEQMVYVINKNYPDYPTLIVDENCETICTMGGFGGQNDCIDWEFAQFIENVWTDPR